MDPAFFGYHSTSTNKQFDICFLAVFGLVVSRDNCCMPAGVLWVDVDGWGAVECEKAKELVCAAFNPQRHSLGNRCVCGVAFNANAAPGLGPSAGPGG